LGDAKQEPLTGGRTRDGRRGRAPAQTGPAADGPVSDRFANGDLSRWFLRVWTTIGVLVLLAGAWLVLREPISVVFPPLALAGVIVYLLNPLVRALTERGIPRVLGTAGAYVVMLGVVVGTGFAVGPLLADQFGDLVARLPDIATSVSDSLNQQAARFGLDAQLSLELDQADLPSSLSEFLRENSAQVTAVLQGAQNIATAAFHALLTLILAPILAFYLLSDLPRITEGVRYLLPPSDRGEVLSVAERIGRTVGAYFRGQLLVATFVAVATAIGLAIIDLPLWALVGLATGIFNLVPLIGPFVGGLIGVVLALTVGDGMSQAIAVVVVMTLVQQVDNHVITPNIIARTVKVHPVTVMLGLLVAASMFGILGMLVVIPFIAAVKLVALHIAVTRFPSMRHLAAEGPGLFGTDLPQVPGAPSAAQAEAAMPESLRPEPSITERIRMRSRSQSIHLPDVGASVPLDPDAQDADADRGGEDG